jgi:hypothetical protein
MQYLLENTGVDQVMYIDNKHYFHGSPSFIWNELNDASLLLTPHRYPSNPESGKTG